MTETQKTPLVSLKLKKPHATTEDSIAIFVTLLEWISANASRFPYFLVQFFLSIMEEKNGAAFSVKNNQAIQKAYEDHIQLLKVPLQNPSEKLVIPALWLTSTQASVLEKSPYVRLDTKTIKEPLFQNHFQYYSNAERGIDIAINHDTTTASAQESSPSLSVACAHFCMSIIESLTSRLSEDEQITIIFNTDLENLAEYTLNLCAYHRMYLATQRNSHPSFLNLALNTEKNIAYPSDQEIEQRIQDILHKKELYAIYNNFQTSHYKI